MSGEPLTILLVEDNDDHAELVARSFEDNQVANGIKRACDGEEALDYLFRRGQFKDPASSPVPNLILLDLRLPKVEGLEVLKEIKRTESLKFIPVVVLTSSAAEADVARAYSNYANSYVVKPLDFTKFIQLMKELGFYWLGWNVNPLKS